MRTIFRFGLGLLVFSSGALAQDTFPGGIVYGPKAAFNIKAPPGWVLDNRAGAEQGLPCVLYPKGSTWSDANTIMYAKIAGTDYEDVGKFVAMAIKEMEKVHGQPRRKSTPEKRATAIRISSTNTRPPNHIRSGNASLTSNCQKRSRTLFSRHQTRRAIARISRPLTKC